MKVLLIEGETSATSATILVPQQLGGGMLETLRGDPVAKGHLAEAEERAVVSAINAAASARRDDFLDPRSMRKDLDWLNKALGEYELGSKIGLRPTPRGFAVEDSEAKRINRAEGLAEGDLIAIGPNIRPKAYLNARGRVLTLKGKKVGVQLDAGDRDRIERATGTRPAEPLPVPLACVEKIEGPPPGSRPS